MLQKFGDSVSAPRWIGASRLAVAVGLAYFLTAHFSLLLLTKPEGIAIFWPAAGIASGTLIVFGRKIAGGGGDDCRDNHRQCLE
jgi:integral membrane sensor domain MASE1